MAVSSRAVLPFSKLNETFFWILCSRIFLEMIKNNDFRGELSDIPAKKEALLQSSRYRERGGAGSRYCGDDLSQCCADTLESSEFPPSEGTKAMEIISSWKGAPPISARIDVGAAMTHVHTP